MERSRSARSARRVVFRSRPFFPTETVKTVPVEKPLDVVREEIRADAENARLRASLGVRRKPAILPAAASVAAERHATFSIAELCQSHSAAFIRQAYGVLLRRDPDKASFDRHMKMLASGHSKVEILGNLRWSAEGRDNAVRVPGLLSRYVLAKLTRVPVLGYLLEWLATLAGLPRLIRHQRASDAYHAAQLDGLGEQSRATLQELSSRQANEFGRFDQQGWEHVAVLNQLRESLRSLQEGLKRDSANTQELRHLVLSMNHWLTSLRQNLSALELTDAEQQREADAWAATVAAQVIAADAARATRLESLSQRFAEVLPRKAAVLDLCSGEDWLTRLIARGINASGVDSNAQLALQASTAGVSIAAADPSQVLARTAPASLDGLSMLDCGAVLRGMATAPFLDHLHRVLRPRGCVLLGFEAGPATIAQRLQGRGGAGQDSRTRISALTAGGFAGVELLPGSADSCILAYRGNRLG
jgi:hypothetical protein